jgi:hypothetical protein
VWWTLWLNRNDLVFRNKLVSSPNAVLHKLLIFMQRWTILSSVAAPGELGRLIDAIKAHIPQEAATGVG